MKARGPDHWAARNSQEVVSLPTGAHLGHRLTRHFRGFRPSRSPRPDSRGWGGGAPQAEESVFRAFSVPGLLSCQVALGKSFFLLGCGLLGQECPARAPSQGVCCWGGSGACPHPCSAGPGPESPVWPGPAGSPGSLADERLREGGAGPEAALAAAPGWRLARPRQLLWEQGHRAQLSAPPSGRLLGRLRD